MNVTHRARGCPFITNVDGEDFAIDGLVKYKGYGDEYKTIYFAGVCSFSRRGKQGNRVFYNFYLTEIVIIFGAS